MRSAGSAEQVEAERFLARLYPLIWDEQQTLFSALPPHLAEMALFAVNTGSRYAEICSLQWDWEVKVPQFETFVFIVPGTFVMNGDDRLIVLNDIARSVSETSDTQFISD